MLTDLHLALDNLTTLLETLWLDYLDSKPKTWLRNPQLAWKQLEEMQGFDRAITEIFRHINEVRRILNNADRLAPARKENEPC